MKSFRLGQRVYVRRCGRGSEHIAPPGCVGTVVRLLTRDDSAWIQLDKRYPSLERAYPFPADDVRGTHVLAWPGECTIARVVLGGG